MCPAHYQRFLKGINMMAPIRDRTRKSEVVAQCAEKGCDRKSASKGRCWGHYQRLRRGQSMTKPLRARRRKVEIPAHCLERGCELPPHANGMCSVHNQRAYNRSKKK